MFKLESYVTPWLLGYLDKYVQLRPEDLQLSLWGGDAVLYNLDLRLDVLQKAMHLPIVFKSGHIHELRLHVPWTKLGSEPMVITINTVECIVKVRDTAYSDSASTASGSSAGKGSTSGRMRRKLKRQATEDLPPGYLQSILNRVVNNVTFIVNNLILKFVEDDIVLSVNVKSAECYSCDGDWNRAFVDITPEDLALRKVVNFSDLTVCLDKTNADGHIENYQEPMLYRCFLTCRLHMLYDSIHGKLPTQTKLNVLCERLNGVMSDTQLPMFLRLIELCLALYYGYLDVAPDPDQSKDNTSASAVQESSQPIADAEEEQEEGQDDQGWAAWMWSMVPQILPEEEEEEEVHHRASIRDKGPILSLGFYVQQASLTFKLTEHIKEKSRVRGQKLAFHPFMLLEMKGVGVEILMQGMTFFSVQCGVGHVAVSPMGHCICGQPLDSSPELLIAKFGAAESRREGELAYNWESLFDPSCRQNQGMAGGYVLEREEHLQYFTEQYGQQRFPAFWMDYLSTLVLPHTTYSGSQSSDSGDSGDSAMFQQEASTCRFLFGPSQLNGTSTSVHRIHKLLCCAWNHHYEPYRSRKESKEPGERTQLTEAQLASLEEFIPTCTYHVTMLQPLAVLTAASHPFCSVATRPYSAHSSRRSKAKTTPTAGLGEGTAELCVSAQRFDLQLLSPMYPGRLIKLVSNIAGPSSNLLYHCHSHTQLKVFSLQAGLQRPSRKEVTWRPVILLPPCSTAFYFRHLLLPHLWNNSHLPVWEHSYEIPQVSVTASKASVLAMIQLLASWTQPSASVMLHQQSLLSDLFPPHGEEALPLSVLELNVCGLELRGCHTPLVQAFTGSLSSLQLLLYTPGVDQVAGGTVPILYGPVDSNPVMDREAFQQNPVSCLMERAECVAFTVQKPHLTSISEVPAVMVVSVEGLASCVDPALLQWFSYMPRKQAAGSTSSDVGPVTAAAVDMPLAKATSPLQTGGSHMSVRSGSSQTQPTTSRLFSNSHTQSRSQSHVESSSNQRSAARDGRDGPMDSVTRFLTSAFPLLRMMQVQVEVKSSCLFVPKSSVCMEEASGDIAANVQTVWWKGEVGEVLVVCLPTVSVHSVSTTTMDVLQDIPVTRTHGALLGEKLPWTVSVSEWSAYTLQAGGKSRSLMRGLSISSTVGATVQYNPPTSDIIQSLALCVHLDLQPLCVSLSHAQMGLLSKLTSLLGEMLGNGLQLAEQCVTQLLPRRATSHTAAGSGDADPDAVVAHHGEHTSGSHPIHETSFTAGTPDVGEAVTTDVSDDVSHHTSPIHTILSPECGVEDAVAKLSIWLQCVLPRLTLELSTINGEVCCVVEDMALSCDVQQVYSKVKSTIGSINIHNYSFSENGERVKSTTCPVLLSTSRELPQHMYVHSNKAWNSDRPSSTSPTRFASQEPFSATSMHGFFSLTFTHALCKSVRRKMKKLNVELTHLSEKEDVGRSGEGLYFHQYVSEVCIKMEPLDAVLHLPTLERILSLCQLEESSSQVVHLPVRTEVREKKKQASPALIASHVLPLMYVDVGAVRVFIPVGDVQVDYDRMQGSAPTPASTLQHDFLLLQWGSVHIQPYADNPLPRYPVQRDLFHQAMQSGMTQQTGSCVEDRQYQLSMHGLALASGVWADLVHCQTETKSHSAQVSPRVQIPALEWNNYLGHRPVVKDVELIPMVTAFDLCLVAAPPIVYTGVNSDQCVVVCGLTAELNVVSDLDLLLSTEQICMMTTLADLGVTLTSDRLTSRGDRQGSMEPSSVCQDSGVASEISAVTHHEPVRTTGEENLTAVNGYSPTNILLTAGRISLTLYTHLYLQQDTKVKPPYTLSTQSSKKSRQSSNKVCPSADNMGSLTQGMTGASRADAQEDCVSFSFMQPQLDSGEETKVPSGSVCVQPFAYVYIAQPHTVLSTWPQSDRLELSCYDILLKGVKENYLFPVTEQRVMPDHGDFSVYWIETRAGQPDSKTGIPPSLLTLQVSSLLTLPVNVEVKLERPMKISVGHETLPQVTDFLQHLPPLLHTEAPVTTSETDMRDQQSKPAADAHQADWVPVQPAWLHSVMGLINHASLQTEQVVLTFDCQDSVAASGVLANVECITMTMERLEKTGEQTKVQGSLCCKDVLFKTVYNKAQRSLAGPVTIETDVLLRMVRQGQTIPLQMVVGVQAGLLLVQFGQEHLMSLRHLLSVLVSSKTNDQMPAPKRSRAKGKTVARSTPQLRSLQPSHDDLRSGAFDFVQDEGGEGWPSQGQAVISVGGEEEEEEDSTLTWAYPHPRVIVSLTTLPVPLGRQTVHTPQALPAVPCQLQYWDECVEEFVTYAAFELSEDRGSNVPLPQPHPSNVGSLRVAHVWRVVLGRPQLSPPSPVQGHTVNRVGVLLAAQLAGSMCVDSAQLPQLTPCAQLSLTVGRLQLHLHNHLMYNGTEGGGRLAGYTLSSPSPQDQQWAVVSVDKVSVVASHTTGPLSRSFLQVSGQGAMEVVDFGSLTLQPVVDPVDLSATASVQLHQQPAAIKTDINTGQLQVHVGRSALHTINTSVTAWTEFGGKTDNSALLFGHLVVCNNTQQALRFGQAGTDENILLQSGHMFSYSWRSHTVKQQLHLCLDQPTWRWCTPLDVSSEGHSVRVVRARDQRYTLVIQVAKLSAIHRQVTVSGQFVVCSRLSRALEVRFHLRDSELVGDAEAEEREFTMVVEGGGAGPSLVLEHEDMKGVSVRLAGHPHLPWSHSLHLSGHAMHTNQLLKVLLPDGVSFIHIWCRIFCQNFNETRQKLIFLSPLYVLRSHLPLPLHARLLTPNTKQQQLLEVTGQGQEYQLHCIGGDVTHQLSFRLGADMVESSPPVVLSSGLVDQVEQTAMSEVNIQSLCQQEVPSLAMDWPYATLQSSSPCKEQNWSEVEQAGVDVNVQLSQYFPGCNTLLVDIFPWCLLTNLTPLPLVLLSDSHQWALPHGCTVAPPALEELRIGCEREGQVWEGTPIPLSGDEVEQHLYSPDLGRVLYLDGQVQLQLLLPSKVPGGLTQVVPLSVVSTIQHKMRVVTISERLRLTNISGMPLLAQLMAAPQTTSTTKQDPSVLKLRSESLPMCEKNNPSDLSATALLDWQLLQEGALEKDYFELVLYMTFTKSSQSTAGDSWSVPVRIASSPEGSRSTVAVGDGGGVSLCVTCTVQGALTYVVVSQDNSPMCWIHNHCPFSLCYGQALQTASFKGLTVQEETELVDSVPTLHSRSWSHYTMPHINNHFPRMDNNRPPRLHVRAVLPATADTQQAGSEQQQQMSEWSPGIGLDAGDTFLHLSGVGHIKVNIQVLSMVYHITFSVLNKAEVSAREVRSRIQGGGEGEEVTRIEEMPTAPVTSPSATPLESSAEEEEEEGVEAWPSVTVGALLEGVVITLHDDVAQPGTITQLLQVELQPLLLACYPVGGDSSSLCLAVCAGAAQIDNVLAHKGYYDFPIILQPQNASPLTPTLGRLSSQQDLTEAHALARAESFLNIQTVLSKDPLLPAGWFLDSVEVSVKPLSMYFEDSFFFRLYEECLCLLPQSPCKERGQRQRGQGKQGGCVPQEMWECARLHQQPLRIQHLCVHPISLLMSVHASVRLFLATDHAPLSLRGFERQQLFTGTQQLAYTMAMHYITAAIFRAGMVVGSMDLLGSPTGLVRSVSTGLSDLVRLPYQGLTRSPAAFVSGVFGGVSSLMRNVTAGMMTSVTNFASSVSRNMDRLSLDSSHQQRQEETRRQRPQGLSSGLQQGLTGFGLSVLGAVAGLVDQPLQTVLAQQSEERPPSAGRRAGSIMAGVGKGLVGVITKPIGGAAELLSQTGQGFLQGSGLRQHVRPRRSIAEIDRINLPTAWLKYSMKMLSESSLLLAVKALQQDLMEEGTEVMLLLTGDMVVVVGQEEDGQLQAFALSQLQCHSPAPAILVLTVVEAVFQLPAQTGNPHSEDRIAAFIKSANNLDSSSDAAVWLNSSRQPSLPNLMGNDSGVGADGVVVEGGSLGLGGDDGDGGPIPASTVSGGAVGSQKEENHAAVPSYHFRMDPHHCQLFTAMFRMAGNRQMGRGFSV